MGSETFGTIQAPLLSFQEILDREDYIICDTSIKSLYLDEIYPARDFSEIPAFLLEDQLESVEIFLELLENSKVLTTKGVSQELKNARDLLGKKISYFSSRSMAYSKRRRRNRRHGDRSKRLKMEKVQEMYHKTYEISKRIAFSPQKKSVYNFLEKIVLSVTKHTDAKIDYDREYFLDRQRITEDFHTDEQLVASAIYLSCIEGKHGAILTQDSDIKRILRHTVFYLDNSENAGYREIFNLVKENPIKVYHVTGTKTAGLREDSSAPYIRNINRFVTLEKIKLIDSDLSLL